MSESRANTLVKLGDFYENKVLLESKKTFPGKDTFKVQDKKKADPGEASAKPFVSKPSGPAEADGYRKEIVDPKKVKGKDFANSRNFSSDTINLKEKAEKKVVKTINNSMSNKSTFDKLYEDVMHDDMQGSSFNDHTDADALGLSDEKGEGDSELGSEEGQEDPKELVKQAFEALKKAAEALGVDLEGGEEKLEEPSSDEGSSEEDDKDSEPSFGGEDNEEKKEKEEEKKLAGEATELKELKDSAGKTLQGKNNKVGDETSKLVAKGEGDGSIKVQNQPSPTKLPDGKAKLQGKNNKVEGAASRVGQYLAGLK